jgi:hypothetical protein
MQRLLTTLLLLIAPSLCAAERFSGSAKLTVNPVQSSANERFALNAKLQAAPITPKTTVDGRFSLVADLTAPAAARTLCGASDLIFKNGFQP